MRSVYFSQRCQRLCPISGKQMQSRWRRQSVCWRTSRNLNFSSLKGTGLKGELFVVLTATPYAVSAVLTLAVLPCWFFGGKTPRSWTGCKVLMQSFDILTLNHNQTACTCKQSLRTWGQKNIYILEICMRHWQSGYLWTTWPSCCCMETKSIPHGS